VLKGENINPRAETHLVIQGHSVVAKFPGMNEANNRAASIVAGSQYDVWVVHLIGDYDGKGSICYITNYGNMYDRETPFYPDDNLELLS